MKKPVWEFARVRAAARAAERGLSTYELTLTGMGQPIAFHAVFNAIAAVGFALLGHPWLGAIAFVAYCAVDAVNQACVRHWLATAPSADEHKGFGRLALMCMARSVTYVAPTTVMALSGGAPELIFFTLQVATLVAVGVSAGMLSRRIFWGFVGPLLAAIAVLAISLLAPAAAAAALLSMLSLAVLLVLMVEGASRTISVLHEAFNDKVGLIPQLQAARDQAVTERAAADEAREEARQAGRAKSNFLATMSHEIRTPMNGVLGMAQLLQRDETDPVQRARLDVLIDSGDYLLSILNDILDVSKIDAGRLDIVPAAEDLPQFLDRLIGFWGPRADEKGVSLALETRTGLPRYALFDALRLRQVLFNLVGNALKFTDEGSVAIEADAMPNGEGAILLHLAVRDSGIGIDPELLPNLFTRFTQADESEVRKFGGTGLGLSIAKQLVELMGGRIWAESEAGQGSTFHIKLPLALADGPQVVELDATPAQAEPAPGLRILAVDDNAVNLMVLDQLLTSFGHSISKASGGVEALAAAAVSPFDLVLLDIQMPGMTGIEVLQHLRAGEGPNSDAPVIALTADVTSGGRRRYLELGFTEHSAKPIQIQELMEAIARALAAPAPVRATVRAA